MVHLQINLQFSGFLDERGDFRVGNVDINSSEVLAGASDTERNNTSEFSVLDEWATTVSLARVLSFLSGANHEFGDFDSVVVVSFLASFTVNYGNFDRLQNVG